MAEEFDQAPDEEEDAQNPQNATPFVGLNAYDTTPPDVYANRSQIIVGSADVSILFGFEIDPFFPQRIKPIARVVISHSDFIRMMGGWNKRVNFLEKAYGETPKSLLDIFEKSPEALREALDELLNG